MYFFEPAMRASLQGLDAVRFQDQYVNGERFTICSYMISDKEIWNREYGLEARGITFGSGGQIVCRPFEKFFNLNEVESTQEHLIEQEYGLPGTRVQEKRDGSMLTPVLVDGMGVVFKTKKSFTSDVALVAQEHAEKDKDFMRACQWCLEAGYTPIFEFTSPDSQIVIDYGNSTEFVLLAIRDMVSGTYFYPNGEKSTVRNYLWALFDCKKIKEFELTPDWDWLRAQQETATDIEGWVVVLPSGKRFKLKTKWYLDRHRLIDLRYRDVAKMVINETLDDIKSSAFDRDLDLVILNSIEDQVISEYTSIVEQIESAESDVLYRLSLDGIQPSDTREFWSSAAAISRLVYPAIFGTVMSKLRGKDVDYKDIWMDRFCSGYSLRSVYNANFGGSDE